METYEVDAGYDGKWWVFDIPALFTTVNGRQIVARGQARTAAEVAGEARDIIAMWTDVDEATIRVEVTEREDGVLELRPSLPVPAGQRWFWAERWQRREREVDEHVAAGRVAVHDDGDALLAHLAQLDANEGP